MIRIGDYNTLTAVRSTSVGVFLEDEEGTEILLPNKYVPENIKLEEQLAVFCYLDHEERPIATTLEPFIKRDEFGSLEVAEVNNVGAFLNWGLEKQLFVPFREQQQRMEQGKRYVVYCYLDDTSFRMMASSKLDRFYSKEVATYTQNEQVSLLVHRRTNLGWEVVINKEHKGLLFFSDVFQEIRIGDTLTGYIKNLREDGKIDVSLAPTGVQVLDNAAQTILQALQKNEGILRLHDKSSPEQIKQELQMSKKSFKKGIGVLYKQRKITLFEDHIKLN